MVVAEDSFLVREGLHQLLDSSPTVEVAATCGDVDSLLEAIERERPDVVLTDIRMPPTRTDEGIKVASQLRDTHPDTGVIILSQFSEPRTSWSCWTAARTAAATCSRSACGTGASWCPRSTPWHAAGR